MHIETLNEGADQCLSGGAIHEDLLRNGTPVSRKEIVEYCRRHNQIYRGKRSVDTRVYCLRRELISAGMPDYISDIYGIGYVLKAE